MTLYAVQRRGSSVEMIHAESESVLLLMLWRWQRVHGAGIPADRWGRRAARVAFAWDEVRERKRRAPS